MVEVVGSSPIVPTKLYKDPPTSGVGFFFDSLGKTPKNPSTKNAEKLLLTFSVFL